MPKLANTLTEARDLSVYLLGEAIIVPGAQQFNATVYHGSWDKLPEFDKLTSVKQGTTAGLDLTFAGRDSDFAMRFDAYLPVDQAGDYRFFIGSDDGSRLLIDDEEVVAFDGIHPFGFRRGNKKLEPGVHRLRIEYFEKGGEERLDLEVEGPGFGRTPAAQLVQSTPEVTATKALVPDKFQPVGSLAEAESQTFQKVGCANCHTLKIAEKEFTSKLTAPPLNSLKSGSGCLAAKVPAGLPDYALSPGQRRALTAALAAINTSLSAADQTHLTLAGFNCYACHARDAVGGPELVRDKFFTTTKQEMGNEARLPPPLTGIGDKLKPQIIQRIIAEGAKDRPYMLTRMPAFAPSATDLSNFCRMDYQTARSSGRVGCSCRTSMGRCTYSGCAVDTRWSQTGRWQRLGLHQVPHLRQARYAGHSSDRHVDDDGAFARGLVPPLYVGTGRLSPRHAHATQLP